MKLVELLKEKFKNSSELPINQYGVLGLTGEVLESMLPFIQKCEEFQNARLIVPKYPLFKDVDNDTTLCSNDYLLYDGTEFTGKCYLYSIEFTPKIFKEEECYKPVKDGCTMTPVMYNLENFKTYKKLIMTMDMDNMSELESMYGKDFYRKKLHNQLDDMLNQPEIYEVKGHQEIIIRGVFNEIKRTENSSKTLF